MPLQLSENEGALFVGPFDPDRPDPEQVKQAGVLGPLAHLAGGGGQPTHHPGLLQGLAGQPLAIALTGRQVIKDRLGIAKDGVAVFEYGHLAEGIEGQKGLLLVLASHQVDAHPFVGEAEQFEQQAHLVAVAGEFVAVETKHDAEG